MSWREWARIDLVDYVARCNLAHLEDKRRRAREDELDRLALKEHLST